MPAAVHVRGAFGTKFNVTYSQLANTSSPSTVYPYIPKPYIKSQNNPFWEILQDVKELF